MVTEPLGHDYLIVGNYSDDPFAIDIGNFCNQTLDVADIISLKTFANTEFCPRFIIQDTLQGKSVGKSLEGLTVVICSAGHHLVYQRNALAMRTFMIAKAAKENGAKKVILVEPDLFYSAQDRGPKRLIHEQERLEEDLKKFDGQPFTADLYASLLKESGVDVVMTVHNHSINVQRVFSDKFGGSFFNLSPKELYAHYLTHSDMVNPGNGGSNLVLCAPDKGATPYTLEVSSSLNLKNTQVIWMEKTRMGERQVEMHIAKECQLQLKDIAGKHVVIMDDMVRTGSTVVECGKILRMGNPKKICFCVTHFYSSLEGRENLNSNFIDEILTLDTIPSILNRDMQGRLRKKIVVLKIAKWISKFILEYLGNKATHLGPDYYQVDMSSKNPRWRPREIF